jgi:aldose 1-epimerase
MRLNDQFLCSYALVLMWAAIASGCGDRPADSRDSESSNGGSQKAGSISKEVFGKLPDGREVHLYTLSNSKGFAVKVTNYGGIITSIITPDKEGNTGDVVLGFDSLHRYTGRHPHMGPLIGRYSGYVAGGKFSIDGVEYKLATNSGPNHLHGGMKAFDKVLWNASEVDHDGKALELSYTSPDGEEGYPGNLNVSVTYRVTDDNSLELTYTARSDKKTHVNLTNHLYFNLSGQRADDIMQHELTINATEYAVPGKGNIPTGEIRKVDGSALDFTTAQPVGARISEFPNGYDHNYVLKKKNDDELIPAATVYEPLSGRVMEVFTTHTGLEFASASWLNAKGKAGKSYARSSGFLLYPQHLPDSPNRPEFPSTMLEPGEKYSQKTVYKFSVKG